MNKPSFRFSRIIQAKPLLSSSFLKKTRLFVGFLFVAAILLSLFVIANIPPNVRGENSIPKPSVPEFTLKFEAHPYDVPPTYGIDPYTGENVTMAEGGHVENKSIVVTIKNQPSSGDLYYNVRYKGRFEESWTELYYYEPYSTNDLPRQSNSEYTVLSLLQESLPPGSFVDRAQVDVQVEALLWHNIEVFISDHPTLPPPYNEAGHYETRYALNETSGWSDTQTITIPTSNPSPPSPPSSTSPSPTSTPDQTTDPTPEETPQTLQLEAIIGAVIAVAAVGAGLLVYFRKHKHQPPATSSTHPRVETADSAL